jgi:presenilin-like A22 family membrane protease
MVSTDKALAMVIDKLNELVTSNSTDAINIALELVRIDCIQSMTVTLATLVTSIGLWTLVYKAYQWYLEAQKQDRWLDGWLLISGLVAIPASTASVVAIVSLCNVYMWIGLFDPKIVLAKRIVDTVLKGIM